MSRGGSVYQRSSDGRWVGKYIPPKNPLTGKPSKPKYVYSSLPGRKGQQDARRKLNKLIDKIEAGDLSDIYRVTVAGWMEKYLEVYCQEIEQTTRDGYENYIHKHIIPNMGDLLLRDLRPIHIQAFYNHERTVPRMRKNKKGEMVPVMKNGKPAIGYSETTILQIHRILSRAFSKAVADGMMPQNPCSGVDAPSPEEYEPVIYNEHQFEALTEKLEGHPMEAMILIAGMCGLRRGELLGLRWEDIDFDDGVLSITKNMVATSKGIQIKDPKSKKSTRTMAVPSVIMPMLKRLRGIGRIFTKPDGTSYSPSSVSKAFKAFLVKNDLPVIRLHDLRHFNCTMMLRHGVSEREAMERSGHSNSTMIKKYQHVLKEMDRASADKLNRVLQKKKPDKVSK